MAEVSKGRGAVKFLFWTIVAVALFYYAFHSYYSGQMVSWYYYKAGAEGYAVNTKAFKDASKEKPAMLEIGSFETIHGLQAVPVKKGDRLPANADGIINNEVIKKGKRAKIEDRYLKVMVPKEVKEAKGFKYKDTFKHKDIKTNPWSGVWNVSIILALGLSLGLLAEGFTDILGFKVEKIEHFEGIH
ncbi:MAG: hypothetical protein AB1401_08785 [Thermodesulfobacteriota bacterium]